MKFEQALKAMRRGEKVRRKGRDCYMAIVNGDLWDGDHNVSKVDDAISSVKFAANLLATDWVIVRKKKPELRDVFKNPKVGDVISTEDERHQWVVIGVDTERVWFWSTNDKTDLYQASKEWAEANSYKILHRAP